MPGFLARCQCDDDQRKSGETLLAKYRTDRKAGVSIELAILMLFLLVPLLLGGIDFIFVLSGKSEIASALQSVEIYAWSDQSNASNATDIGHILDMMDNSDLDSVVLASHPQLSFQCLSPDGSQSPASIVYDNGTSAQDLQSDDATAGLATQPEASPAIAVDNGNIAVTCATGDVQAFISYALIEQVYLPVSVPYFPDYFSLTENGNIWLH